MIPNPHLPAAPPNLTHLHPQSQKNLSPPQYHHAILQYAQSLWLQQKPAQAILQLNKAAALPTLPAPFQALAWFLTHRQPQLFMGNPVRHFQHLASRISGPNPQIRCWRAWACFHLAEEILPPSSFPRDLDQISLEHLEIPTPAQTLKNLPNIDLSALPPTSLLAKSIPNTRS